MRAVSGRTGNDVNEYEKIVCLTFLYLISPIVKFFTQFICCLCAAAAELNSIGIAKINFEKKREEGEARDGRRWGICRQIYLFIRYVRMTKVGQIFDFRCNGMRTSLCKIV